jgi:hypothetical protein
MLHASKLISLRLFWHKPNNNQFKAVAFELKSKMWKSKILIKPTDVKILEYGRLGLFCFLTMDFSSNDNPHVRHVVFPNYSTFNYPGSRIFFSQIMRVTRVVKYFFQTTISSHKKASILSDFKGPLETRNWSHLLAVCKYVLCVINVLINFLIVQKVQLKNI